MKPNDAKFVGKLENGCNGATLASNCEPRSYVFYKSDLNADFAEAWSELHNGLLTSDVFVRSEGKKFKVHSKIMSSSCDYFKKKLNSCKPDVIDLPSEVSLGHLEPILEFIYNGQISIDQMKVESFIEAAKVLGVHGLKNIHLVFDNEEEEDVSEEEEEEEMDFHEQNNHENNFTKLNHRPSLLSYKKNDDVLSAIEKYMAKDADKIGRRSKNSEMIKKKTRRYGTGRLPLPGSPIITEDFKVGDRYRCKVCDRAYLWKKTLVWHYKNFH